VDSPAPANDVSPRDRFITVYGRMPVLEALRDPLLVVEKVLLAGNARGNHVDDIVEAARAREVEIRRVSPTQVNRVSRNGRHDQGVVADVVAPRMAPIEQWDGSGSLVVLDGLTNPQNVGMILRTAAAAGLAGIVVPRAGVADIGPLVIKASAGVAFTAPILRCGTAAEAVDHLRGRGARIYGMSGRGHRSLFDPSPLAEPAAFVLGGETDGVQVAVDEEISIPLSGETESLNVAVAAGVLCFELVRRSLA